MANKKKTEIIGIIDGYDLTKKAMPKYVPNFRCGKYLTEKDRPRKKINKKNMDKYMQELYLFCGRSIVRKHRRPRALYVFSYVLRAKKFLQFCPSTFIMKEKRVVKSHYHS